MPHRRPTRLIGDRHASLETDTLHQKHVFDGSPIRYVSIRFDTSAQMKHVNLRWVSDQVCWSPIGFR